MNQEYSRMPPHWSPGTLPTVTPHMLTKRQHEELSNIDRSVWKHRRARAARRRNRSRRWMA